MTEEEALAERFESERARLRAVAYRMLGSLSEADDVVQEAWVRLSRTDASRIENLSGWLTVVTSRLCLDLARARTALRETPMDVRLPDPIVAEEEGLNVEERVVLTGEVGLALQVVLGELRPRERLAFVLHDIFAVPFDQIAPLVESSVPAARQLASRARSRVREARARPDADLSQQRTVVDAFLAAAREGDLEGLLAVLDPECVLRADAGPLAPGFSQFVSGADRVAGQAVRFSARAHLARQVLVNGAAGVLVEEDGRPVSVIGFTVVAGRVVAMDILADPQRLEILRTG